LIFIRYDSLANDELMLRQLYYAALFLIDEFLVAPEVGNKYSLFLSRSVRYLTHCVALPLPEGSLEEG
jgi:hypothetical protein